MYRNCSRTARIGAIKWAKKFETILKPIIEDCYNDVVNGIETDEVLNADIKSIDMGCEDINNNEMWKVKHILNNFKKNDDTFLL